MKRILLSFCLILLAVTTAGAEMQTLEERVWYRMHFGMGLGTNAITPELFTQFIDKQVTPRFPEGLTVTVARGQWNSPQVGVIREKTAIVDIQGDGSEECKEKIKAIAEAYTKRFKKARASMYVITIPGVTTTLWY